MTKSYFWSKLYVSAVLETDFRKLPLRIREAEWAIQQRLYSSLAMDFSERQTIREAKNALTALKLKTDRLRYLPVRA
jgi:hypothetical protein